MERLSTRQVDRPTVGGGVQQPPTPAPTNTSTQTTAAPPAVVADIQPATAPTTQLPTAPQPGPPVGRQLTVTAEIHNPPPSKATALQPGQGTQPAAAPQPDVRPTVTRATMTEQRGDWSPEIQEDPDDSLPPIFPPPLSPSPSSLPVLSPVLPFHQAPPREQRIARTATPATQDLLTSPPPPLNTLGTQDDELLIDLTTEEDLVSQIDNRETTVIRKKPISLLLQGKQSLLVPRPTGQLVQSQLVLQPPHNNTRQCVNPPDTSPPREKCKTGV